MFTSRALEIAKCRTAEKIRSLRGKSFCFQDMWISEKGIRVERIDHQEIYITDGLLATVNYLICCSLAWAENARPENMPYHRKFELEGITNQLWF